MIAVVPFEMLSYDADSQDQVFRNLTCGHFGLYSVNAAFSDPNSGVLSDTVYRPGYGRPGGYCQRSGNRFPEERLVMDGDGRIVGDMFYTSGSPEFMNDDIQLWGWTQ